MSKKKKDIDITYRGIMTKIINKDEDVTTTDIDAYVSDLNRCDYLSPPPIPPAPSTLMSNELKVGDVHYYISEEGFLMAINNAGDKFYAIPDGQTVMLRHPSEVVLIHSPEEKDSYTGDAEFMLLVYALDDRQKNFLKGLRDDLNGGTLN